MTDEQFKQMMAVQIAQLAALQGIMNAVVALVPPENKSIQRPPFNWQDVDGLIKTGLSKSDALKSK